MGTFETVNIDDGEGSTIILRDPEFKYSSVLEVVIDWEDRRSIAIIDREKVQELASACIKWLIVDSERKMIEHA